MSAAIAIPRKPNGATWHSQSAEDALAKLGSSADGLSGREAANRLAANGPNELEEGKRASTFHLFLGQFKNETIGVNALTSF